jgi:hypothetical protein
MSDDITQKLRVTMPDFKGIEISCPCRIRSSLMKEAADEIEKLTRERNEARAEVERLRAERDTLLLDAREFVRWFNRHYPDPSRHPDHPWCEINNRLMAHADTLAALNSGLALEGGR